jgi:hypothetical protein
MPRQIGIFVNGWAVSLNRNSNVTMLQTYTPAAELTDAGDFVSEFRSKENSRSIKTMKFKEDSVQIQKSREELRLLELSEKSLKKTLLNTEISEIQKSYQFVNLLTSHVIETSSEIRTVQYQFSNYTR